MSIIAYVPCFVCGKTLRNVDEGVDNQPQGGTEFRTYGHYGSTFWDSLDGEELVLNVCDGCLHAHCGRLAQHKRFLPVKCEGLNGFGQQWVQRPLVPFTGNPDDASITVEPEELGTPIAGIEWSAHVEELKAWISFRINNNEGVQ